jgi:hypothetical protein
MLWTEGAKAGSACPTTAASKTAVSLSQSQKWKVETKQITYCMENLEPVRHAHHALPGKTK